MQIGVRPDDQTKLYEEIEKLTGWEREQTNKEWIQSATTEQLAEFLFKMAGCCSRCGDESQDIKKKVINCPFRKTVCVKKDWEMWLKQPHREE